MINKSELKKTVEKYENKRIGEKALKKLNKVLENEILKLIKHAARRADFAGRVVIKEGDFEND